MESDDVLSNAQAGSADFMPVDDEGDQIDAETVMMNATEYFFQKLQADPRVKEWMVQTDLRRLHKLVHVFVARAFDNQQWPAASFDEQRMDDGYEQLFPALLEAINKPIPLGEDVMVAALGMLTKDMQSDVHVIKFCEHIRGAAEGGQVHDYDSARKAMQPFHEPGLLAPPMQPEVVRLGAAAADAHFDDQQATQERSSISAGDEIDVNSFDELRLEIAQVQAAQAAWRKFISEAESPEAAGEAIYSALFEGAPSLQSLFTTPRAVQAMKFMQGLSSFVGALDDPPKLKILVETLGFGHLQLDVTIPRVIIFRDAILDLLQVELNDSFTTLAYESWKALLNYVGGAIIFVKKNYAERIELLVKSWKMVNDTSAGKEDNLSEDKSAEEKEDEVGKYSKDEGQKEDFANGEQDDKELRAKNAQKAVPKTYPEMFRINAAVMGFQNSMWLSEVLLSFDSIVVNVANSARLQEECEVLALRLSITTRGIQVNLAEYRSCMLASLRALLPKSWSQNHEVSWNWLWDNVERLLTKNMGNPPGWERSLSRYFGSLDENQRYEMRKKIYERFFELAPVGQDFFKQSNTRLHFIAERIMEMTLDIYRDPQSMVDEISALGLRHVGYAIPTDLFAPFVTACIEVLLTTTQDNSTVEAFRWSLGLIAKMLVRTITEGSTIVMKAINANSIKQLTKAITYAPRISRATWMLHIQVGTKHISPLLWAIESGSLEAANAIIMDLLTFRADREKYYYGADELFARHPDIIQLLCDDAPALLQPLLDGLVWRSRVTTNGMRRVNYYVKHLIVNDVDGGVSTALKWITISKELKIISHPIIALISDTFWTGVVRRSFILSKIWFIFSLLNFMLSQAVLPKLEVDKEQTENIWWAILVQRSLNYAFGMTKLIYEHVTKCCSAFRTRDTFKVWRIPIPKYLADTYSLASFALMVCFLAMCAHEPMWYCVNEDTWPTEECDNFKDVEFRYAVFCMLAMGFHWALLVDLAVFSTKLSAFVLVCGQVMNQVGRFMIALMFLLLTFGSSISVLQNHQHEEFKDVPNSLIALFGITLGMYEKDYRELLDTPALLTAVFMFVTASVILLMNLLIAQLNCSYDYVYQDMVGFARLNRGALIVEMLAVCPPSRWGRFVKSLRLDTRIEFNEGDVGVAGGIQANEPASLNVVLVDSIQRYGGSCSPEMPWPEDDQKADDEDKFAHMEKLISKAMKRLTSKKKTRRAGASSNGTGAGTGTSGTSDSKDRSGGSDESHAESEVSKASADE